MKHALLLSCLLATAAAQAQPETLLDPARALQGYLGISYCSTPLSELDFEAFFAEFSALPNDRLRFEKIRVEVHALCLATPYVLRMMEKMEQPAYEYDMMRLCFYYCADPGNFSRLLPYMDGASFRESMATFLRERLDDQRADVEGQRQLFSSSELARTTELLQTLDSDQSRLQVAIELIQRNNLLSEQVRPLMDFLQLAANRKALALEAVAWVYDPANYFLVTERLPRKEREEVMALLQRSRPGLAPGFVSVRQVGCTYRVVESEVEQHLATLRGQPREDLRLRLAVQLFENNCFSVMELKKVMREFESDEDRLQLVQSAAARVFDPWNIYLVNAEFQRAVSVDGLFRFLSAS